MIRSQTIAPDQAGEDHRVGDDLMSIIPEPTVLATAVPNPNAAAKLKNAAQMTALPGVRTRVDTTVAIEFAAS